MKDDILFGKNRWSVFVTYLIIWVMMKILSNAVLVPSRENLRLDENNHYQLQYDQEGLNFYSWMMTSD